MLIKRARFFSCHASSWGCCVKCEELSGDPADGHLLESIPSTSALSFRVDLYALLGRIEVVQQICRRSLVELDIGRLMRSCIS